MLRLFEEGKSFKSDTNAKVLNEYLELTLWIPKLEGAFDATFFFWRDERTLDPKKQIRSCDKDRIFLDQQQISRQS